MFFDFSLQLRIQKTLYDARKQLFFSPIGKKMRLPKNIIAFYSVNKSSNVTTFEKSKRYSLLFRPYVVSKTFCVLCFFVHNF